MQKKNAFTLVELLIVLAIMAILMSIAAPKLGHALDGARERKCGNNLKQLHSAVITYAMNHNGSLPWAQSHEHLDVASGTYSPHNGWVSWVPKSSGKEDSRQKVKEDRDKLWKKDNRHPHSAEMVDDLGTGPTALHAIETGEIYEYVGSIEFYACPLLRTKSGGRDATNKVWRSYAMNPFFYSPSGRSWRQRQSTHIGVSAGLPDGMRISGISEVAKKNTVPEPSKLLLFTEIVIDPEKESVARDGFEDNARSKDHVFDCVIHPEDKDRILSGTLDPTSTEVIFANHPTGPKRSKVGLAVFFDGHIEKFTSGVGVGGETRNTAWYLIRGLNPDAE